MQTFFNKFFFKNYKTVLVFVFLTVVFTRTLYFSGVFKWLYFLLGEILIFILCYIFSRPKYDLFWENLTILRQDLTSLEEELSKKHLLLSFDFYIIVLYTCAILYFSFSPSLASLYCVLFISILMLTLFFLREYFVYKDKMLENRFNFKSKSLLQNPTFISKRFVGSYLFKKAAWVCYNCGKYILPLAPTLLYLTPKVVYSWDYRPPVANFIGYRFTCLYHKSEVVYALAMKFYLQDASVAPLISDPNGLINESKLLDLALQRQFGLSPDQINTLKSRFAISLDSLTDSRLKIKLYEEIDSIRKSS